MTDSHSQPSTDALVRRLRQFQADEPGFPPLFSRAATEIESIRAQLANARKALESMLVDPPATLDEPDTDAEVIIKMREIARAALKEITK